MAMVFAFGISGVSLRDTVSSDQMFQMTKESVA